MYCTSRTHLSASLISVGAPNDDSYRPHGQTLSVEAKERFGQLVNDLHKLGEEKAHELVNRSIA
jgi:hypothetical protein